MAASTALPPASNAATPAAVAAVCGVAIAYRSGIAQLLGAP